MPQLKPHLKMGKGLGVNNSKPNSKHYSMFPALKTYRYDKTVFILPLVVLLA